MIKPLIFIILVITTINAWAQPKTIHVFVALCDNVHQGIVPVPSKFGNGKDPNNNLYWGAAYGLKTFLKYKTSDWNLVKTVKPESPIILQRLLFKHSSTNTYLLADAYDGEQIKTCTQDFLKSANGQHGFTIAHNTDTLKFGGNANLLAYTGHNGLMEFNTDVKYVKPNSKKRDVVILACFSKFYFTEEIKQAGANPILWTTHLMAPETYTLKAAIDGWLQNEADASIEERAAQAYNKYQKCGINSARNLFTSGF